MPPVSLVPNQHARPSSRDNAWGVNIGTDKIILPSNGTASWMGFSRVQSPMSTTPPTAVILLPLSATPLKVIVPPGPRIAGLGQFA
jgi:hypothetical protein